MIRPFFELYPPLFIPQTFAVLTVGTLAAAVAAAALCIAKRIFRAEPKWLS